MWTDNPVLPDSAQDVNMAVERRQTKPQSQQSPPRRPPYTSYGDGKESRPRSRSPGYARDGREPREGRDGREVGRDSRSRGHSRDPDYRYRRSESREKDPREPAFRYFRNSAEEGYRRKEESYRDPYRDPWNGRRELEDDRSRPEEQHRNELYRQYYEELQRRYDIERPVDCSVIVINKAQNREYAETVGRKVRDLGMVVDLIFLNTEVSLTQALEDVGRARTPFAIIITQQHQLHRSCTVNILFGTPQEHRNMPMQDAMMLVAHNYDTYKVENREKEREEIARKAAKMADDVLGREVDSESHPLAVLTIITLISENRFVTIDELDTLILYLREKRARMLRASTDQLSAAVHGSSTVAGHQGSLPPLSHATHTSAQTNFLQSASSASVNSNHQQELQAKILSLFNNGSGGSSSSGGQADVSHPQAYGSYGPSSTQNPSAAMPGPASSGSQVYANPPASVPGVASGVQKHPITASGINFDSPSVQKALDTILQSGPSLAPLVGTAAAQQSSMGPVTSLSTFNRHY